MTTASKIVLDHGDGGDGRAWSRQECRGELVDALPWGLRRVREG